MTFTDDDLKRLKKQLEQGLIFTQDDYDFETLIARLEAAELFKDDVIKAKPTWRNLASYQRWCYAAGKNSQDDQEPPDVLLGSVDK